MNKTYKEIIRQLTEKGINLDNISEQIDNISTPQVSEKDIKDKLAMLAQLTTPQPTFTLTPEEVKIVRKLIHKGMDKLGHEIKFNRTNPHFFKNAYINNLFKKEPLFKGGEKILTRIKQWQNENNN